MRNVATVNRNTLMIVLLMIAVAALAIGLFIAGAVWTEKNRGIDAPRREPATQGSPEALRLNLNLVVGIAKLSARRFGDFLRDPS